MMMIIIMIIIVVAPDAVRPTGAAHLQTILYSLSVDSDR
jgi:hypothetical protein